MSIPRQLFTPAFQHQHLGRSFATIVGIMVFIASFAMAAEAVLMTASYLWGQTMENRITVEIPAVGDEASMPQAERIKQVLSVLRALPNVELAVPLSDSEVERLLSPWFDKPELLKALPLPTLIDVERKQNTDLTAPQIQTALKNVVSDARVNDHGAWTKDVWRLVHGLSILGSATIALTALALVIAVNLICRTIIATERETISLLHLMGAENMDIANHFQSMTARIALQAASIGFLIAVAVTSLLVFSTRHLADLSTLGWEHWAGIGAFALSVPLCAVAIVTVVARVSVLRLIKTFP